MFLPARPSTPTFGTKDHARSHLVRSDPHQLLAEVGALEKSDECGGRAVDTLSDEFAMLDLALAHPLRISDDAHFGTETSVSLYCAMRPQTGTRANALSNGNTASNTAPPTFSK